MMEVKGNTIILEAGEEVTIRYREKEEVVPTPTPPSDEPDQPDVPDPTPEPQPEPEPQPQPTGDCRINISIRNEGGRTVSLNGELRLILANPDVNGVYHGCEGLYNRTGRIRFSDQIDIAPYTTATFISVSMENTDIAVRGRNLVASEDIPATGYQSNVQLYDMEGNSEVYVPEPADSNIIFNDGAELLVIVL